MNEGCHRCQSKCNPMLSRIHWTNHYTFGEPDHAPPPIESRNCSQSVDTSIRASVDGRNLAPSTDHEPHAPPDTRLLDRHEHTWTHDEEGEKKHTTHKHISKRYMKNTQSKSKKQTCHQMWFFCVVMFFICAFSHNQDPCMFFVDTLRKLLNSNGGASEPLSTCNNSPQVEVKMVGKRQVLSLFVENQTFKHKISVGGIPNTKEHLWSGY